ncbi:hypothetical protein [Hephaestia mangrovi]|nr:hypothetical protein [Hephaestia mangrovi]MBY8827994.1 hypothetical protein [Hephaestia mangrovi]
MQALQINPADSVATLIEAVEKGGRATVADVRRHGEREIALWKRGVTL